MNDPEIVRHAIGNRELMRIAVDKPKIIQYAKENPDVYELIRQSPEYQRKMENGSVRKTRNGNRILPLFLAKALIFGAPAIAGMIAQG